MLGWNIRIYRRMRNRSRPAPAGAKLGERVAVWQAGLWGQDWLNELVESGSAIKLQGGGYPNLFTVPARHVLARIQAGIPDANDTWIAGPEDILGPGWEGKTVLRESVLARCEPDEWLIAQSWDES
jgi:hypothetical protein